jgi:hypothetical protein
VTPDLGDVVVRARGLARHLLPEQAFATLAAAGGSGAFGEALAQLGYPAAPEDEGGALSAAEAVDAAVERETARRLGVLARWLAGRRTLLAGVFEDEERRVLRILLRRAAAGRAGLGPRPRTEALASLPRRAREALATAADVPSFVRTLRRARSPYAPPLTQTLRAHGPDLVALEGALDRTFAQRARFAARRSGGSLLGFVADAIDLENAWDVLLDARGVFVEGGRWLSREKRAAIAREATEAARRAELARAFVGNPLAAVFADADAPVATLESRAQQIRFVSLRRAARSEPLGPAALLEVAMRLRAEAARLRRIGWTIAQGMPAATLADPFWEAAR